MIAPPTLTIVLLFLAASTAYAAASDVPEKTGDFVAFCQAKKNETSCRDKVINVELALLTIEDKRFCEPTNVDTWDDIPGIIKWLAAHSENHGLPTSNGIAAAWIARYPCKR